MRSGPAIRTQLLVGLVLIALVTVGAGALAFRTTSRLVAITDSLQAASTRRAAAEDVLAATTDAETGQRGYVLTGDPRFLEPYDSAVRDLPSLLGRLHASARGAAPLPLVDTLVSRKLAELERVIALRRAEQAESAAARIAGGYGKAVMDSLRLVMGTLDRVEAGRIDRLRADANRLGRDSLRAVVGLGLALVLLLGGLGWLLRRYLVERRRAEAVERELREELEAQVDELTEVNRDLDGFAYTVSHDLRAPLRAMQGFATALDEDYGDVLPPDARGYVERIAGAGARMDLLVQDLLAYNRLTRTDLAPVRVAPAQVVEQALAGAREAVDAAGAAVRVALPADLPPVLVNRAAAVQIVVNLLTNAVKFVPPGRTPEVVVRAAPRGRFVRLTVKDNGIGVAAEHHERIFRVFERLHGGERYPGTGIGLAIVRRGAQRMHGDAGIESGPDGDGSTFWVDFPAATG